MTDDAINRIRDALKSGLMVYPFPSYPIMGSDIRALLDEIDRLRAELADAKRDAERYRWLRGDSCPDHSARWTQWEVRRWRAPFWTGDLRWDDLDAAIDAARGAG